MLKLPEGEIRLILQDVWERYPLAREHAHREGSEARWDFNILAGKAVQAANIAAGGSATAIGCNWRRAVVGDLSMDGLSVLGPDGRYYFRDIIAEAGSSRARVVYSHPFVEESLLRDALGNYAPQGFADPRELSTHFKYSAPVPPVPNPVPPPPPVKPCPDPSAHLKVPAAYPDENTFWKAHEDNVVAAYAEAGREIDSQSFRWFTRVMHDIHAKGWTPERAAEEHLAVLRIALGLR